MLGPKFKHFNVKPNPAFVLLFENIKSKSKSFFSLVYKSILNINNLL